MLVGYTDCDLVMRSQEEVKRRFVRQNREIARFANRPYLPSLVLINKGPIRHNRSAYETSKAKFLDFYLKTCPYESR